MKIKFIKHIKANKPIGQSLLILFIMVLASFATIFTVFYTETASAAHTDFGYYKTITIDHTKVEGNTTDNNMVIWVYNTSNDFRSVANGGKLQADADDIAFYSIDNSTQYKHDIEVYDAATGEIGIWVNISDNINASTDFVFYCYYNDSDGTSQSDMDGTWDAKYSAVYHFNVTTGNPLWDSSGNNRHLTVGGTNPTSVSSGKLGKSMNFTGTANCYYYHTDHVDFNMSSGDFTFLAWAKGNTSISASLTLLAKGLGGAGDGGTKYSMSGSHTANNEKPLHYIGRTGGDAFANLYTAIDIRNWTWHQVVFQRNNSDSNICGWTDGDYRSTSDIGMGEIDETEHFVLGAGSDKASKWWDGEMDEVWIIKGEAMPGCWVNTTFNNQNDPDGFMTFSAQTEGGTSFSIRGLEGADYNVTFSGVPGAIVWSNETAGLGGTLEFNMTVNASNNVTEIRVNLTHISVAQGISNNNISIQVSSDNTTWGANVTDYSGTNFSVNTTTWIEAEGFYGANPFLGAGITDRSTSIYFIFRLMIHSGASTGTYSVATNRIYPGYYS